MRKSVSIAVGCLLMILSPVSAYAATRTADTDPGAGAVVVVPTAADADVSRATSASDGTFITPDGRVVGRWKRLEDNEVGNTSSPSLAGPANGDDDWNYGTYVDGNDKKHCWSFYKSKKYHSATAQLANWGLRGEIIVHSSDKKYAESGLYASAEVRPGNSNWECMVFHNVIG